MANLVAKAAAPLNGALAKSHKKLRKFAITATLLLASNLAPNTTSAEPIDIISLPIDHFNLVGNSQKAGDLTFLGGLELRSTNEAFGGISGIRITDNGKQLLAISDTARWFTAKITRDETGKLKHLTETRLDCICQADGKPYKNKRRGDAEALEIKGNRAYIAFERVNRINGYDLTNGLELGDPVQATASFDRFKIGSLQGLEALALAPKTIPISGSFITFDEDNHDSETLHSGFIANAKKIEPFFITATDDYKVTDASFLPTGELLMLERRVGITIGVGVRIRQFDGNKIAPGKTLMGKTIMEAGLTNQIDNMEGLATWKNEKGETIITLISDDNFNRIQRTLLLDFKMTSSTK